jgi:hypothetical protein
LIVNVFVIKFSFYFSDIETNLIFQILKIHIVAVHEITVEVVTDRCCVKGKNDLAVEIRELFLIINVISSIAKLVQKINCL